MGTKYLQLIEKTLSAYTEEHIVEYFDRVKREGLTEHGFPRLTSNIGILIANGKLKNMYDLFCEMMEFCCKTIPHVKAANDFSIREVVCCMMELEKNNAVDPANLARWKEYFKEIDPYTCYDVIAKTPTDPVRNWALFTGVSEYFRNAMGLGDSTEFIDIQIASQLQWLDENGMYMDNGESDNHQPIVYDICPRGLFSLLLFRGYRGKYYKQVDEYLRKSGLYTLKMQSVTGELPYGGRSNQFLLNEGWLATVCEYEAARYKKEGDLVLAGKFKAAAKRAVENTEYWLSKTPISHVKNCYPFRMHFGCELYAYFDKYMITAASNYYAAHLFCDDSIETGEFDDSPSIWCTSDHFHKVFARAGGYFLEYDKDADPHYDASGLGRVHKYGAPSTLCLSMACCGKKPRYKINGAEPVYLALCPGIQKDGEWDFSADPKWVHTLTDQETGADYVSLTMESRLDEETVTVNYKVDENGVSAAVSGKGEIAYALPAFTFDGEKETEISVEEHCLRVTYEGWVCRYTFSGKLEDSGKTAVNRNGHYRKFYVTGRDALDVKIELVKK
ncbi:MAG: hypothetical protein E7658_00595 [Ruminococcaceae bacterium]|nr:hypothetical protein [Oscillospiraceae bacterium]